MQTVINHIEKPVTDIELELAGMFEKILRGFTTKKLLTFYIRFSRPTLSL